jgi:excisionase family DNA binding protein
LLLLISKVLLNVEEAAEYLGVGPVTVYRWCREGRLPCLKVGRAWRVRREALEDFLRRGERPVTLVGQLASFLRVPDNVLGVAQNLDLLHALDAAFLRVGEARGGLLVKFLGGEPESGVVEIRRELEAKGLEARCLESEGRLQLVDESGPVGGRAEDLRRRLAEADRADGGRTVWASFDWTQGVDLGTAIAQQEEIAGFVDGGQLVVKTALLEEAADQWPGETRRRARMAHSAEIWLSPGGLSLSHATALPKG